MNLKDFKLPDKKWFYVLLEGQSKLTGKEDVLKKLYLRPFKMKDAAWMASEFGEDWINEHFSGDKPKVGKNIQMDMLKIALYLLDEKSRDFFDSIKVTIGEDGKEVKDQDANKLLILLSPYLFMKMCEAINLTIVDAYAGTDSKQYSIGDKKKAK